MGCNRVCPKTDTCSKTHFLRFRVATQIVLCVRVIDSLVFLPVDQAVLQHGLQKLRGDLIFVGHHRIHQQRISESCLHIVCLIPPHIRPCNQGPFYRFFTRPISAPPKSRRSQPAHFAATQGFLSFAWPRWRISCRIRWPASILRWLSPSWTAPDSIRL